jgi:hypothetical protein
MNSEAVTAWAAYSQKAINLLAGGMTLLADPVEREDLAAIRTVGNYLVALTDLVDSMIDPPTDRSQREHWDRLVSLTRELGNEAVRASTTLDVRPVAILTREIAGKINGMTDLLRAARA